MSDYTIRRNGARYPRRKQPPGSIQSTSNGYRRVFCPGHPLANAQGHAQVHRLVLANRISLSPTICHHCFRTVDWFGTKESRLVVDHLDDDKTNNSPENLVPSCTSCNAYRVRSPRIVEENYQDNYGAWSPW